MQRAESSLGKHMETQLPWVFIIRKCVAAPEGQAPLKDYVLSGAGE